MVHQAIARVLRANPESLPVTAWMFRRSPKPTVRERKWARGTGRPSGAGLERRYGMRNGGLQIALMVLAAVAPVVTFVLDVCNGREEEER
jgi:hypothetical protein